MIPSIILVLGICFLAYSNGANDNFKGVATLFGSGTTNYRVALTWATGATLAGSLCSLVIAESLAIHFSGKGLVPDDIAGSTLFLQSVAIGAGLCVWIATASGLPISTTHSLVGALVGAGFMAAGTDLNLQKLGTVFLLPLLLSPLVALILSGGMYRAFRWIRRRAGWEEDTCICLAEESQVVLSPDSAALLQRTTTLGVYQGSVDGCAVESSRKIMGVELAPIVRATHYLSAGGVCFARGLNDTPKIVAALITAKAVGIQAGLGLVAIFMAVGGIVQAKKVAATMSKKITPINEGQGLSASLVTFVLVVIASRFGMPVSTTHVSVGSIFGIGMANGGVDKRVAYGIVMAWTGTLPLSALLAALVFGMLQILSLN